MLAVDIFVGMFQRCMWSVKLTLVLATKVMVDGISVCHRRFN